MKKQKQNEQSAAAIFNQAQSEISSTKKTRHSLSTFEEVADKATEKATKKSLFEAMLAEQRGLNANCKLFAKFADDSRMLVVIRAKGVKVLPKDFAKVFTAEFICDNLRSDVGGYRYNKAQQICKVTLPKKAETLEDYESRGYESTTNKDGKKTYLLPMSRYTFDQFLTLVKIAVANYWAAVREAKVE